MAKITAQKPKTIRDNNLKLILDLYKNNNILSIAEISKSIKLSRTTVMKINEHLIDAELIISCGKGDSTTEGGKKPQLFSFNKNFGYIICYHIVNEEINIKIFNLSLEIIKEEKIKINENESLETIVNLISNSINEELEQATTNNRKIIGIALAVHAITDSKNGICLTAPHFPSWGTNRNLKQMVRKKISAEIPLFVDSWIRFKAFNVKGSELTKNYSNFVLIDAGRHGIVSGVVINGQLHTGKHYLSGEIGHTVVSPNEKNKCYCGGKGCLETFIDCKNLIKTAIEMKNDFPDSIIFSETQKPEIFDIFSAANQNDKLACLLIDKVTDWFAIGISNINLMFDPDILFFEGDYAKAGKYFTENLRKKINSLSPYNVENTFNIVFQEPEYDATLSGAGAYIKDDYFSNKLLL
jgi:N-acetylglucosamine repressor